MPQNIIRREEAHLYADQPATEAGRELSAALLSLRRAEQAQEVRTLRASGLSSLDLRALRYIVQAQRDGRDVSPKDLIVMLRTSSANITNVVARLVEKGHVERISHPTDRRAHHLKPTETAVRRVEESVGAHHSELVAEIDRLPDVEATVAARVIARIAAALDDAV